MSATWDFVLRHGYALVFAAVLLEQLGAPVPTAPVLILAGALAGLGHFSFGMFLLLGVAASLAADFVWYELGRRRGEQILGWLCRLSLEPSTCVRRTTGALERWGPAALLMAKFVPGLNTVAPPLAGSAGIGRGAFLLYAAGGAALWVGAMLGLGLLLGREAERAVERIAGAGSAVLLWLGAAAAAWVAWKLWRKQAAMRHVRVVRIRPEELRALLDSEEPPLVIDLRSIASRRRAGAKIPSALIANEHDLAALLDRIPRTRPVVFYCSCPDEASSAAWALRLRGQGFRDARPLAGGFEAWTAAGYPVEELPAPPQRVS